MKFPHPEGTHNIIAVAGTQLLGKVTKHDEWASNWITIGCIGHPEKLSIERSEWKAFMNLINEINEEMK